MQVELLCFLRYLLTFPRYQKKITGIDFYCYCLSDRSYLQTNCMRKVMFWNNILCFCAQPLFIDGLKLHCINTKYFTELIDIPGLSRENLQLSTTCLTSYYIYFSQSPSVQYPSWRWSIIGVPYAFCLGRKQSLCHTVTQGILFQGCCSLGDHIMPEFLSLIRPL